MCRSYWKSTCDSLRLPGKEGEWRRRGSQDPLHSPCVKGGQRLNHGEDSRGDRAAGYGVEGSQEKELVSGQMARVGCCQEATSHEDGAVTLVTSQGQLQWQLGQILRKGSVSAGVVAGWSWVMGEFGACWFWLQMVDTEHVSMFLNIKQCLIGKKKKWRVQKKNQEMIPAGKSLEKNRSAA